MNPPVNPGIDWSTAVAIEQREGRLWAPVPPQAQSAGPSLVYGIALHAFLVGQPYRLRHLRRALEHIARHRDRIWLATTGQIARHFAERVPFEPA